MIRWKRVLSLTLAVVFAFVMLLPNTVTVLAADGDKSAPARIQGVTYKLKSDVLDMPAGMSGLYSKDRNSLILPKNITSLRPAEGQIFVDRLNKKVIRVGSSTTDTQGQSVFQVAKPSIAEVFEDFKIPKQTVRLTEGNVIKNLVPGVTLSKASPSKFISSPRDVTGVRIASSLTSMNESYSITEGHQFDIVDLTILDVKVDGVSAKVKANGSITLGDPKITVEGEFNENFRLEFQATEVANLKLTGEVKLKKHIKMLVAGYSVPFEIGEAFVGVYLVFDADGQITVMVEVDQGAQVTAGIKGDLWTVIPYSVEPYATVTEWFNVNTSINGYLKARAAVVPQAGLKLFDYDFGRIELWLGLDLDAKLQNTTLDLLVEAFLDVDGYLLDDKYEIYEKRWLLYESHEKPTARGAIKVTKADAYLDLIQGSVTVEGSPYIGQVKIMVHHPNNLPVNQYTINTDQNGLFSLNKSLLPNDVVYVSVSSETEDRKVEGVTDAIMVSVPFSKISITSADAFNDIVKGEVSGSYSGPAIILVTTGTSTASYRVSVANGQFSREIPLKGGDQVQATLSFEGLELKSFVTAPILPLRINILVDDQGTRGTVQNMEGNIAYTGNATISSTN